MGYSAGVSLLGYWVLLQVFTTLCSSQRSDIGIAPFATVSGAGLWGGLAFKYLPVCVLSAYNMTQRFIFMLNEMRVSKNYSFQRL